jgi:uncharacterized protein YjbI with pentapeptide repeats
VTTPTNGLVTRWSRPEWASVLEALARDRVAPPTTPRLEGRADLRGAPLEGADLVAVQLDGADLREARLSGANLSGARLVKALLEGAQLARADLGKAQLTGARLGNADLSGALLPGASLLKADLAGARLDGATLDQAILEGSTLDGASFFEARLVDAFLEGVSGVAVDFARSDLRGCRLQKTNLHAPSFAFAQARGARFARARLVRAYLAGADLEGADLRAARLADAYLDGANLDVTLIDVTALPPDAQRGLNASSDLTRRLENRLLAIAMPRLSLTQVRFLGRRVVGESFENARTVEDALRWLLHLAALDGALPALRARLAEQLPDRVKDVDKLAVG